MVLEKHVEELPFKFKHRCFATVWVDGKNTICGKPADKQLVIGTNRVTITYCDEHLKEKGYL